MRGLAFFSIFVFALLATPVYTQEGVVLKGPKGVDYGAQGRSIGPIRPTDTLWRIAQKVRPDDSVTIYQVMKALYDKNPNSFLDKNLNHMQYGTYLRIPTINEIRSVDPTLAKQKSDQDDRLWDMKRKGLLNPNAIEQADKKVTQARKVDVEEAKEDLTNQLRSLKMEQDMRLMDLQKEFKSSVRNVEEILSENNKLKQQLGAISTELQTVRTQLGKDSEIQQQLKAVIDLQNEMIEQQAAQAKAEESDGLGDFFSSMPGIALLATLPALLALAGFIMFMRRKNQAPQAEDDDEFLPSTPAAAGATAAATAATFAAEPDPLDIGVGDEDTLGSSVQLDDDILPEDDEITFDSLDDDFEDGNDTLDQDELDSLLNEDISFDDSHEEDFMQQSFEDSSDEIPLDVDDSNDILSDGDLDDLFNEPQDEEVDVSDDALAALSEELADEQVSAETNDDIDSILDGALDEEPEFNGDLENESLINADDIDALLNEAQDESQPELEEEPDILAGDDIDALLDEAQDESQPELEEETDILAGDDIDALLDEAQDESQPELEEEPDILAGDDIDALLDEAQDESQPELEEETDILAGDDIDALLDEA
ncbi:FimV/HubP family polar landmark protein, partial [Pseudoalteromonas peptidolytica]|uniref:FimV/HubP family polar landmark protein n=1 Tax=Pseudoalteromonas peptidolytica TaxID=61150 RepID=UPI002452902B